MSQNGKGSKKRPSLVSYETWEKNWNQIFKPQLPKKEPNHGSGRKSSH